MKPLAKGLLIGCAGILLLMGMFVGFGFWLYRTQGPGMMEGAKHAMEDGARAGVTSTGQQCIDAGLAMQGKSASLSDGIRAPVWMQACLEASPTGREVCPGVPGEDEFMRSITWRLEECERRGMGDDQRCTRVLSVVQRFCRVPVDTRQENRKP